MTGAPVRNLILVVCDSARRDVFDRCAPTFQGLTAGGRRFDRAIAPGGWSLPSHVSMFTGLLPTEHGAVALGRGKDHDRKEARKRVRDLAARGSLLTVRLSDRGIRTLSVSANPWVSALSGLDTGFNETNFFGFLGPGNPPRVQLRGRLGEARGIVKASGRHLKWVRSGRDKGAEVVLETIGRFLEASRDPFFIFTNLIETHEPHIAPAGYRRGTTVGRLAESANIVLQPGAVRALRMRSHNWGRRGLPEKLVHRWWTAYEDETRYVDDWLGRLVETLERTGVAGETAVMVTADHGENFGEEGVVGHGLSLKEALANVPLGIWGAGIEAAPRDNRPVSLTQLPDTIEALMFDEPRPNSLLERTGTAVMEIEDPQLVSRPPRGAKRISKGPGASFYDGDLKSVRDPFAGELLFDLSADPDERHDLAGRRDPTPWQSSALQEWSVRAARFTYRT